MRIFGEGVGVGVGAAVSEGVGEGVEDGVALGAAITAGFFIGKYYDEVFSKDKPDAQKLIITQSKNVSVAISQNSELIILDRNTGNIAMFSDTVGINIFKLYANQIAGSLK